MRSLYDRAVARAAILAAVMTFGGCDEVPIESQRDASTLGNDATTSDDDAATLAVDAGTFDGDAAATRKRVFVTRRMSTGMLGGIAGADAVCETSAAAAKLGGTWKAWISDSQTDAVMRLSGVGPWYFVDGTTKVFDRLDRTAVTPLAALVNFNRDEYGDRISTFLGVWTGTLMSGLRAQDTCANWTTWAARGTAGNVEDQHAWSGGAVATDCRFTWRLYCFED